MGDRRQATPLPPTAPLLYPPRNEQGVIYLFATVAGPEFGLRVSEIRTGFPDCIAVDRRGKRVRIEFELASRNFRDHKHRAPDCDWIVCWQHNWPGVPAKLRVVELRRIFGLGWNVWFQPLKPESAEHLPKKSSRGGLWSVPSQAGKDDLLLVWRTQPQSSLTDLFRVADHLKTTLQPGWKSGKDWMAPIERVATLGAPVTLDDLRRHRTLGGTGFVRGSLAGRPKASMHWPALYREILRKNPSLGPALANYGPERLTGDGPGSA